MTRRVAITGAGGQLGRRLVESFAAAGEEVLPLGRPEFELGRAVDLQRLIAWRPDVVINCAAWTDVDGCARDPTRALEVNGEAAGLVAGAAARAHALAAQVSTNEVFDGTAHRPYREDDEPSPINPYGASKLLGERLVAEATKRHLIVRTAWLYDPERDTGFPARIRAAAERMHAEGKPLRVVADEWGNPTPVTWLVSAIRRAIEVGASGILHLAGQPAATRHEWARAVLSDVDLEITPITLAQYTRPSRVPPRAVLDTSRMTTLGIDPGDWRSS